MADPTNPESGLPDPAKLEQIKNILTQIYDLGQRIATKSSEAGTATGALAAGFKNVGEKVDELRTSATQAFDTIASKGQDMLRNLAAETLGLDFSLFDESKMLEDLNGGFAAVLQGTKQATQEIQNILSTNRINLAEMIVFEMASSTYASMMRPMMDLEKRFTDGIKSVSPAISQIGGGFIEAGLGAGEFSNRVSEAMTDSALAAQATGLSVDEARTAMNALGQQGLDLSEIFHDLASSADGSAERTSNLTASMRIAAATGMSMNRVGTIMQQNVRMLGREINDTGAVFAALSLAQKNTGLSMDAVSGSVTDSAKNLRYYGTSVESLSNTFNAFITSVGRGRQELGRELFESSINNIEKMNFGLKAFLGMQSQIGQGRGAIGAGLEVEQALAEGRTGEIFTSIREQLERMGGGAILTRQDALDTGQETQYLMQRQLLSKLTGDQDAGRLEAMMGVLQRGEIERSAEIFAKPEDLRTREAQLLETGQRRIDMDTGPFLQGLNRLGAEQAESVGKLVGAYDLASKELKDITENVLGVIDRGFLSKFNADAKGRVEKRGIKEQISNPMQAVESGEAAGVETIATAPRRVATSQDIEDSTRLPKPTKKAVEDAPRIFPSVNDIELTPQSGNRIPRLDIPTLQLDPTTNLSPGMSGFGTPGPAFNLPPPPVPVSPTAGPPAVQKGQTEAAAQAQTMTIQLSAEQLEIPLSFKIDGDSLKISMSSMEQRITTKIKKEVLG